MDPPLPRDALQHSSQPSPQQPLPMGSLAPHPSLEPPYGSQNSVFTHHIPSLETISTLRAAAIADFSHHAQGGFGRHPNLPPLSTRPGSIPSQPGISNMTASLRFPTQLAVQGQHRYGMLTPSMPVPVSQPGAMAQTGRMDGTLSSPVRPGRSSAPMSASHEQRPQGPLVTRIVVDPPNLHAWRERLFNVDDTIAMSDEEFKTYWPHVDNVYSHRSTQTFKRNDSVSTYWDCRLKGRPPGTPKSDDPNKKKRKRSARERDLCDVKIKITEHFPEAPHAADDGTLSSVAQQAPGENNSTALNRLPPGDKFWTIQRVNGNGANGKGNGIPGPHKHTLAKSDEIKKSSVQRYLDLRERESKKEQSQKRPSGNAFVTAKRHSKEDQLMLYAASFCPFSQRVWIALEAKDMHYQYCETDPFRRPTQLLEANPRGLVPAIRQGDWATGESTVILEYLEDLDCGVPLLPTDPRLKANCRLWIDHINARIVPAFFKLMRALDHQKQTFIDALHNDITALVQAADERGPYFLGSDLCLVDVHLAPFVVRMSRLLGPFRGWPMPVPGTRWHRWADALEHNPHVRATTSLPDLYRDTVEIFLKGGPYGEQPRC